MALEDSAGINVKNHYGARETGGATGVLRTAGNKTELAIELTGTLVDDGVFIEDYVIPAGSLILAAYIEVDEAFVLGGTTPTILVGTDGSEVTNGLVVSEAIAEATGAADLTATLTGTWAAKLAAATTVGVALGGTTPTVTSAGTAKLVIEYI
jgi:hypothetical protein